MNLPVSIPPLDWAKQVNRSWIVRNHLDDHAEQWLQHLSALNDGRLLPACEAARAMCYQRGPLDDPKLWFYAGLFSPATAAEANHFLAEHHGTKATVPAMHNDEGVRQWLANVSPETRDLFARLRDTLTQAQRPPGYRPHA